MKINYNLLISLFSFIAFVSISSCKPPDETPPTNQPPKQTFCDTCLPPITTTGPTSFGCRVNGKVWLPKDGFNKKMFADYYDSSISIIGTNGETMERVGFALELINDTGTFIFPNNTFKYSGASFGYVNRPVNEKYSSSPIKKGKIQFLRFDIDSGKYAGIFEFDLYSNDFKDTIHITDGRFMIHK